ncbi:MAG: UDP-N-acetylmuramate--L-alanine ligase [Coxiellaceae bacterium]|nr:UDP-N-acetylmuramate--L-alanine ligase [Coxiellaceae bacterium]
MGVGGVGVCGVAEILHAHGYQVTGSDIKDSANTQRLQALGINITIGHDAENVKRADAVVYSSAISDCNPEWQAAKAMGIPVIKRAEMLAELMQLERGIAIAGTHGKTTTTSLVTHVLLKAGINPSFAIGGELKGINRYAGLGAGDYFVAEADESDASFLHYAPEIAVVTNIDADHMETYAGSFDKLKQTFTEFLQHIADDGLAVLAYDDETVRELIPQVKSRVKTYGFHADADIQVLDFLQKGLKSYFVARWQDGRQHKFCLNFPGQHNVLNALAALCIADELGIDMAVVEQAFADFPGVGRRFHIHGSLPVQNGEALIIDDYGHHPHEVKVTLQAARQAWPERRLVLVFQPHRYTRTRDLLLDFAQSLAEADVLVLLEVYAAGEAPIENADGQALCQSIADIGKVIPIFVPDDSQLASTLQQVLQADDIVLMQGAGSIGGMAQQLLAAS